MRGNEYGYIDARKRIAKIEALRIFASDFPEQLNIPFRLHSLQHDDAPQFMGQAYDRAEHHSSLRIPGRFARQKALVDLDRIKWHILKLTERRQARAEIVDRDAYSAAPKPAQHRLDAVSRADNAFRQLQLQCAGLYPSARDQAHDKTFEFVFFELPARNIHAHEQGRLQQQILLPLAEIGCRARQRKAPKLGDESGLLRMGDEIGRRELSSFGVVPAQKRLETGDRAVAKTHDG